MSPIKRTLSERYGDALLSPKRLRGGGGGEDDEPPGDGPPQAVDEDELFDDDLVAPAATEEIPDEVLEQAAKDIPETAQQRWKRPDLPADFDNGHDLNLQWIDMDVVTGKPLAKHPNPAKKGISGSKDGPVPVLRCYGVDDRGHSVSCFIHGFTPYAYFALPPDAVLDENLDQREALGKIRDQLDVQLKSAARGASNMTHAVQAVFYEDNHKSIFGYDTPYSKFLKVYVALPGMVPALKRIMESGIMLPSIVYPQNDGMVPVFAAFECNVPFVLRFMVDREITGAGWLTLPANTYSIRDARAKETHCQVRQIVFFVISQRTDCCFSEKMHFFLRRNCVSYLCFSLLFCAAPHFRLKLTSFIMILFHANQRENGIRSPLSAFFRWISSVKEERGTSPKPRKILSFRSPTW